MSFRKVTALASVACLAGFLGYKYVSADPPGYCAAQGKYISDEEFIKISEARLAWGMKEKLKAQMRWASENPGRPQSEQHGSPDSTLESFERWQANIDANRKRPGFAKVDRSETRTIFRWLFGYQQLTVRLNANVNSVESDAQDYVFNVCGHIKETWGHLP